MNKKLFVVADPVQHGKHPLHDCRFICTKPEFEWVTESEGPDDSSFGFHEGAVIATMTDCENQRTLAVLFAHAQEMFAVIQNLEGQNKECAEIVESVRNEINETLKKGNDAYKARRQLTGV